MADHQKRLGYTDEEAQRSKDHPWNADVLSKGKGLADKLIILEVVQAHSCNSGHKKGDKFYFGGSGNLLTELCPQKVRSYSLNSALMMVYTANEMLYAGVDPNEMRFKRAGCSDIGLDLIAVAGDV